MSCCGEEGGWIWGKYLRISGLYRVFLEKWNLLVGRWGFFFFYRFIGNLDWDSGYPLLFSFLLSVDREFFDNLFYFGISRDEMEFEWLYHWFFLFLFLCLYWSLGWYFIGSLGIFINFFHFLYFIFLFRHDDFSLVIYFENSSKIIFSLSIRGIYAWNSFLIKKNMNSYIYIYGVYVELIHIYILYIFFFIVFNSRLMKKRKKSTENIGKI